MWKLILLLFVFSSVAFSQDQLIGRNEVTVMENGKLQKKIVLNPLPNNGNVLNPASDNSFSPLNTYANTVVKWSTSDAAAIGDLCVVSENGKYSVTSWNLNNQRISLYGNTDATPAWDFPTSPLGFMNFIAISDTGGVIGTGSYQNIYLFNNTSNVPFFNFDLTRLSDTGIATGLALTGNGSFLVASVSRQDSSTVFGFNANSTTPVWSLRIVPSIATGGGSIQGVRMSGNDSLVIVNTYAEVFVINTFTGQQRYRGFVNPGSPTSGTQSPQGISGNGNVIATINYTGTLRVFEWNGSTYNFLWANTEPAGQFFNWYTSVDISYDGQYITGGTLNFVSSSTFDGKVKFFRKSILGTPVWTYAGCGDEVSNVSFSKSANILSAASWGDFNNGSEDLYIFKPFLGNVPIFKLATPGSFFYCSTSGDGRVVVASGKAVHARQLGSGGLLYNISVDTTDIPPVSVGNNSVELNSFSLSQNYPNPFNPSTVISYQLTSSSNVKLVVYNALGCEIVTIVNQKQNTGSYSVEFNGSDLSSGIYFYELTAGELIDTKRMILLK
ncbi:MAG: T9SS type A sorting domain-containing protein [bacterium]|nr:T9SS type A sorting domain-containing protein [bacterium]